MGDDASERRSLRQPRVQQPLARLPLHELVIPLVVLLPDTSRVVRCLHPYTASASTTRCLYSSLAAGGCGRDGNAMLRQLRQLLRQAVLHTLQQGSPSSRSGKQLPSCPPSIAAVQRRGSRSEHHGSQMWSMAPCLSVGPHTCSAEPTASAAVARASAACGCCVNWFVAAVAALSRRLHGMHTRHALSPRCLGGGRQRREPCSVNAVLTERRRLRRARRTRLRRERRTGLRRIRRRQWPLRSSRRACCRLQRGPRRSCSDGRSVAAASRRGGSYGAAAPRTPRVSRRNKWRAAASPTHLTRDSSAASVPPRGPLRPPPPIDELPPGAAAARVP